MKIQTFTQGADYSKIKSYMKIIRIKAFLYSCQEFGWDRIILFIFDLWDIISWIIQ